MRNGLIIFLMVCGVWLLQSCGGRPFACYTTTPELDSIRVNQPVTFRATCSSGADSYFWEFYDTEDSTEYGFEVTKTFYDTGKVQVFLLVTGGGKTSSTEDYITVRP